MTDTAHTSDATFFRAGGRNRFTAREGTVTKVSRPVQQYVRVTLSGGAFSDFVSTGPSDHVKVFFPDPETGVLTAPAAAGPDQDGIVRPDGPVVARDFTPLRPTPTSVDLDFLLHADPGPAASWAELAREGDRLVVVGPRGSRDATQNAPRVLLVVDGTSLPAAGRWLAEVPESTAVDVIADIDGGLDWVGDYLEGSAGRPASSLAPAGDDLAVAAAAAGVDAGTYVFAAGEASRLVSLRRYLRYELALPPQQYAISGYWRRGESAFDHHAPIDPADPD